MKFKNMKIKILDEQHLTAVCDVLESMGYNPYQPSRRLQFIYTQVDGLYSFGDECISSIAYETVTLRDLLQMRDDLVRQKAEQRATHPEPLPFIDDEPPAYFGNAIRQKPRERVYAVLGEWSPDWSQAPEWADAWRTTESGQSWWTSGAWQRTAYGWKNHELFTRSEKAPSFGYAGDWKQSETRRTLQHVIIEQIVSA